MKTYSRCHKSKPLPNFTRNSARKDGLNHACKQCHRLYTKHHYQENKSYYLAKAHDHNRRMAAIIDAAKDRQCTDCKASFYSWQMDFDHVGGEKEFNLGLARWAGFSESRIRAELAKCELVCANCHRHRTYIRQHSDSSM